MLFAATKGWDIVRKNYAITSLRSYSYESYSRWAVSATVPLRHRSLSTSNNLLSSKKRKGFFSSNTNSRSPQRDPEAAEQQKPQHHGQEQGQKRNSKRSPMAKNSLRRVAVAAQRSKDGHELKRLANLDPQTDTKTVTAICAAEQYDIAEVSHLLQTRGHQLDPYGTGLYPQVVHIEIPVDPAQSNAAISNTGLGDVFVFPSGTVVSWAVPETILSGLVSDIILPAAVNSHPKTIEEEDLEYIVDNNRETSSINGDTILLGTKQKQSSSDLEVLKSTSNSQTDTARPQDEIRTLDTIFAKIAFSSGLARSTKLAVLETLLDNYFLSTKSIPAKLSLGGRIPFTQKFILQKTGELLSIRAQLNLYSELTDSLPDLFWDSRHELGLESYFDQVGRALDTNIRIKILNEKMDYAQEIASVLRQQLSEQHAVRLEWIIILLITVEVGFATRQLYKEYQDTQKRQ